MVFSVLLVACALGVGACFLGLQRTVRQEAPYASRRVFYTWLGAALALVWAQVALAILWAAGVL